MFIKKCAAAVVLIGLISPALRAFEVQYATLFKITDVQKVDGLPVMPLSNGKYADVRVLDKETFDFLKTCNTVCKQPALEAGKVLPNIRPAKTRENMWIAELEIDGKWLLVSLIFRKGKDLSVKFPPSVVILNKKWQKQVEEQLLAALEDK